MLYENEFYVLKEVYNELPSASRAIAKILSALPLVAVALFGFTLVPLGIIGLGTVIMIGLLATTASVLMMAYCIPCGDDEGVAGFISWMGVLWSLRSAAPAAVVAEEAETAPVLRMAANDAVEAEQPQPVQLAKRA